MASESGKKTGTAAESEKKLPEGFSAVNQFAIEYLQGKYGQDVQLSSTTAALRAVIDVIERDSVIASGITIAMDDGGYCKQAFDRTIPGGYSRLYDKCSDIMKITEDPEIIGAARAVEMVKGSGG